MDYTATSRSDPPPTSRRTARSTDSWRPRPTTTLRPVPRRGAGRVGVTKAAGHLGPPPQTVPGHRRTLPGTRICRNWAVPATTPPG